MESKIIKLEKGRKDQLSQRLKRAKWSYATRRMTVDIDDLCLNRRISPKAGDVVLAKVKRLGKHKRIELATGRRARMFVDDDIVVVYGNRYAPDQFEAIVPEKIQSCHLVAAGGIAGQVTNRHEAVKKPTDIMPVGILAHTNAKTVNLIDHAVAAQKQTSTLPPVIAVVGGSMNTGKTTTAASLIRGLTLAGFNVTAGKVTGTGSGCDVWHMTDAGARLVLDFLDVGYPSTYLLPRRTIETILYALLSHLSQEKTDFIILEVADGLFQSETYQLVSSKYFQSSIDGVFFTAADSMGAVQGVHMLQQLGVSVFGVSGIISRSPLGVREVLDMVDIPVFGRNALAAPSIKDHVAPCLDNASPYVRARGNG